MFWVSDKLASSTLYYEYDVTFSSSIAGKNVRKQAKKWLNVLNVPEEIVISLHKFLNKNNIIIIVSFLL